MATHSVFLPGESHGPRSLAGYSPWSRGVAESDATKRLNTQSEKGLGLDTMNSEMSKDDRDACSQLVKK